MCFYIRANSPVTHVDWKKDGAPLRVSKAAYHERLMVKYNSIRFNVCANPPVTDVDWDKDGTPMRVN